jgi:hypothetical protein
MQSGSLDTRFRPFPQAEQLSVSFWEPCGMGVGRERRVDASVRALDHVVNASLALNTHTSHNLMDQILQDISDEYHGVSPHDPLD